MAQSDPVVLSQHSSVLSLAVLRDGRLASGGESGKIKFSLTDQGDLIAALCDRAGPNLTRDEWTRYVGPDIPWRPGGADPADTRAVEMFRQRHP